MWLLLVAASLTVQAQTSNRDEEPAELEEAHARFKQGLQLYDEDSYQAALIEFQRAYDLAPVFRILYNIAQVQYQLQDYAAALRSFEKYLQDGGTRIATARRTEVQKDIDSLRARVGFLSISASVSGAEILVDGVLVGREPLTEPVAVNVGSRRLTSRLDGFVPMTKLVEVEAGDSLSLRLELVEEEPPVLESVPVVEPSRPAPKPVRESPAPAPPQAR